MLTLTVLSRERISPHFVSITLGGPDFRHLEQVGYDQSGRLFFAGPGQREVVLPSSERWMLQQALQPGRRRARVRSYSIRRFRPEMSAFDVEIAVHEEQSPGPGAAWARTAAPGEVVAFLDEGCGYVPTEDATWRLLVGDESALPAILAIVERSADALPTTVFLEVPGSDDVRPAIPVPPTTTIHWLPRDDSSVKPGTLALRTVRDADLPPGPFYTWVAGESSLATGVRRHLVDDRGVPKSDITFRGYWRHGRASLG